MIPPDGRRAVWDALLAEGVAPAGLGARDTLRLEVCFHLYGNDLSEDRNPLEAGLGWCCKLDTGFIGADALRDAEPEQLLVPFAFTGPGHPAPGQPGAHRRGRGRGHERHAVALPRAWASAWPTCRARRPSPARRSRSTCAASARAAEVSTKPLYEKKERQWPTRATPRT